MRGALHRVRVWDWPTRAIHWLLVLLIPFAWWTWKTDHMQWHRIAGYAVLALLAFRLFWGLFGSETARFAHFVRGPRGIWRYVAGRTKASVGHNPLGGLSVIALLALASAQAGLGLFAVDEDGLESGPFASVVSFADGQRAEHWHGILFNALLALIALHIAAIALYALAGNNLVGPMIGGTRSVPVDVTAPKRGSIIALIAGLLLAGTMFAGLMHIDGG